MHITLQTQIIVGVLHTNIQAQFGASSPVFEGFPGGAIP